MPFAVPMYRYTVRREMFCAVAKNFWSYLTAGRFGRMVPIWSFAGSASGIGVRAVRRQAMRGGAER
jgi:hypothetical protein